MVSRAPVWRRSFYGLRYVGVVAEASLRQRSEGRARDAPWRIGSYMVAPDKGIQFSGIIITAETIIPASSINHAATSPGNHSAGISQGLYQSSIPGSAGRIMRDRCLAFQFVRGISEFRIYLAGSALGAANTSRTLPPPFSGWTLLRVASFSGPFQLQHTKHGVRREEVCL